MSEPKNVAEQKSQKSSEVEYIASRLNSVMETYRKMLNRPCA